MFCKNCGRQIPDEAAFCPACGTKRSGGDMFGETKSGRDIKNLPSYAKENDLNRSGDAIDTNRQKFSLSGNEKKFSLSGSGQKKFSLSDSGQKKFSLSDKGRDSSDGIVRITANREPAAPPREPTGFVNPLKDSGRTVFHDEPAGNTSPESRTGGPEASYAPEEPETQTAQAASVVLDDGAPTNDAGGEPEEKTGFVNPLKGSGQEIRWGSDGDRNETKNAEVAGDPSEIESHLGFAVFTLLCCCQPTSILAILFAVLVSQEVKKGNYEQAQKYSNLAKLFCWISIGLSIFCGGISSITNMDEWRNALNGTPLP